jgi:hypothetical protein
MRRIMEEYVRILMRMVSKANEGYYCRRVFIIVFAWVTAAGVIMGL